MAFPICHCIELLLVSACIFLSNQYCLKDLGASCSICSVYNWSNIDCLAQVKLPFKFTLLGIGETLIFRGGSMLCFFLGRELEWGGEGGMCFEKPKTSHILRLVLKTI